MRILNDQKKEITHSPVSAVQLADIIKGIDAGTISGKIGKTIFEQLSTWSKGPSPSVQTIIKDQGLVQVTDTAAIESAIKRIIDANAEQVAQYRAGKEKVFGFFVGQVMKEMKGQGAPQMINDILKKKLKGE
jgi:aspartyl-tRNA(Asn)/glutamyl-tRNA(Gln) amidotransferase subunit B